MGCTLTVPVTVVTPGDDDKANVGPTQTNSNITSNRVLPLTPLPPLTGGNETENVKAKPTIRQQGTFKSGDLALKGALQSNECTHLAMPLKKISRISREELGPQPEHAGWFGWFRVRVQSLGLGRRALEFGVWGSGSRVWG
jgi:hypothetical protein